MRGSLQVPVGRFPTGTMRGAMSRDHSFMQGIQSGDVTALQELLQEYWHPLVAYAIRLLSDRDEAEDVVQEAVLRVWNGRSE